MHGISPRLRGELSVKNTLKNTISSIKQTPIKIINGMLDTSIAEQDEIDEDANGEQSHFLILDINKN